MLTSFTGCAKYSDSTYFKGDIFPVDSRMKKVKNVTLTPVVPLDGLNFGIIAVYDSLMLFWNPKLPDRFFNVFNLDTGADMGTFCHKGQGPGEMVSVSPVYQIFEEENELKTLLLAAYNKKILKWNISRSVRQQTTVIDTIIDYSCNVENMGACYNLIIFLQNEDILFTRVPSVELSEEEASLPFYQKRTLHSDKMLKDYPIYGKSIKNGKASIIPEAFFGSVDNFNPDGSKIVQAMRYIQQLNILDTETGKVTGYRVNGSPDFSIFEAEKKTINPSYVRVQADEQYIYASFWGKKTWGIEEIPVINTIHVFDWNGRWLYELKTDRPVHEMWLDRIRNRLYTTDLNDDDVFYLDLNEIN
jgi:hypothetical protein